MSVARLKLLPPELLPANITAAARRFTRLGLDDRVLHNQDRVWVRAALAGDGLVHRVPVAAAPDEDDDRLGIARVGGDEGAVFLSGLLVAYLDLMDHMRPSSEVMLAATALFDFALDRSTALYWDRGCRDYRGPAGDRLYCALTQVLVFAVAGSRADDGRDWAPLITTVSRSAKASIQLCEGKPPVTQDHRQLIRLLGGNIVATLDA